MTRSALTPLAALLIALALPAAAQDSTAPAADAPAADAPAAGTDTAAETPAAEPDPSTDFSTGEDASPESAIYVAEESGDWEVRCMRQPDGYDPCQIYQLLEDQNQRPVAELTLVSLPGGGEAAAGATLLAPLETLLTAAVTFSVDGARAKRYPFTWCDRYGCYSRIGFTGDELSQLKRGKAATAVIVPMLAPDQKVEMSISLIGFTKAFDSMSQRNVESAAAREAATPAQEAPAEGAPAEGGN